MRGVKIFSDILMIHNGYGSYIYPKDLLGYYNNKYCFVFTPKNIYIYPDTKSYSSVVTCVLNIVVMFICHFI